MLSQKTSFYKIRLNSTCLPCRAPTTYVSLPSYVSTRPPLEHPTNSESQRAIKIIRSSIMRICIMYVCVCPPLDKGFPSTTPIRQGRVALPPYHTQRSCGREWEAGPDQPCVPAELLTTLSNWLCLIPWFFMLPPPNLLVPSSCAAGLIAAAL